MASIGFPDFQEAAQWQSVLTTSGALNVAANQSSVIFPLQQCSHWANIQLTGYPAGHNSQWVVTWYADATHNLPVGGRFIDVRAGSFLNVTLPNQGPFVEVKVTADPFGAVTGTYIVSFNNRPGPPFYPPSDGLLFVMRNNNLPAGASVVEQIGNPFSGPAMLFLDTDSNAWNLNLEATELDGTVRILNSWTQTSILGTFNLNQAVILPPKLLQLRVTNNGAGFQLYTAALTADLYR